MKIVSDLVNLLVERGSVLIYISDTNDSEYKTTITFDNFGNKVSRKIGKGYALDITKDSFLSIEEIRDEFLSDEFGLSLVDREVIENVIMTFEIIRKNMKEIRNGF
jgi:hypothetical protein